MLTLRIITVGRTTKGPEGELCERYISRARALCRQIGFKDITTIELKESAAQTKQERMALEAKSILEQTPKGALMVLCDERGQNLSSSQLAQTLQKASTDALEDLVFVIGGPDGLADDLKTAHIKTIAFGAATWPHMLVKAMLFEQIYRAMTILASHPYHRE